MHDTSSKIPQHIIIPEATPDALYDEAPTLDLTTDPEVPQPAAVFDPPPPPPPPPPVEPPVPAVTAARIDRIRVLMSQILGPCPDPDCEFCQVVRERMRANVQPTTPDHPNRLADATRRAFADLTPREQQVLRARVDVRERGEATVVMERAKEIVREQVILPVPTRGRMATEQLREVLSAGSELFAEWANVPAEVLGELTHAEPSLYGAVLNAQQFIDEARFAVDRATGRLSQWATAFRCIVSIGTEAGAWEYVTLASQALADGPHTDAWDDAVEWFTAAWVKP